MSAGKQRSDGGFAVVLVPSDSERTRTLRFSPRALRVAAALGAVGGVALALLLGSWWFFAAQAAQIPVLERRIVELQADNARVEQLAHNLSRLQAEYDKIRSMLGGDILATGQGAEPLPAEEPTAGGEGLSESGLSREIPTSWPLAAGGFVTQELEEAQAGAHPGVDIAVAQHSYIRASGAGVVVEAGADSIYGLFVMIQHGSTGYRSMYGHASRLFVAAGDTVRQNEVIALSGNTGRSTAPHLHFEILKDGTPIDPFTMVQQRTAS